MKVFYVMVLVLVAGAVPSHGRTESEGTIFNKTQPHESMNNVTVNSSKTLVRYNDMYLAMQWPSSYCNSKHGPCFPQQARFYFTVHGLWPHYSQRHSVDCTAWRIFGNYPLFNIHQIDNLMADLNHYWPDLKTNGYNNYCFWAHEYNKHGSCTFSNPLEYFELTIRRGKELSNQLSGLINTRQLIRGTSYAPNTIEDVVRKVTFSRPNLKCIKVAGQGAIMQLLEIRFCVRLVNNVLDLVNCRSFTDPDCGNLVLFP